MTLSRSRLGLMALIESTALASNSSTGGLRGLPGDLQT